MNQLASLNNLYTGGVDMALYGQTDIILYNEDGSVHRHIRSKNLVTNAFRNLLNLPMDKLLSEATPSGGWLNNILPAYSSVFGGVLLFSEPLEESPDHIIPYPQEVESLVGYAGQGSSLQGNIYRGTFNATESSLLPNGFTSVWDFGTNEANGSIKAVALTSSWGGEQGWKASAYDLSKFLIPVVSSPTINDLTTEGLSSARLLTAGIDTGVTNGTALEGYSYYRMSFFTSDGNIVTFGASATTAGAPMKARVHVRGKGYGVTTENAVLNKGTQRDFFDFDGVLQYSTGSTGVANTRFYIQGDSAFFLADHGGSELKVLEVRYSPTSQTVTFTQQILDISIIDGRSSEVRSYYIRGNDLYTIVYDTIALEPYLHRYNRETMAEISMTELPQRFNSITKSVSDSIKLGAFLEYLTVYHDTAIYRGITNLTNGDNVWLDVPSPLTGSASRGGANIPITMRSNLPEPYILTTTPRSSGLTEETNLCIVAPFLATINNLSNPVEKTFAKTMKIIYTLTDREEE